MPGVKGRSGGHNAKTVQQLKTDGTFDPSRHAGIENPLPLQGMPMPPAKLGKIARKEWKRMVGILSEQKLLSRDVAGMLYQYCQLFEKSEAIAARQSDRAGLIDRLEEAMHDLHGEQLVEAMGSITSLLQLDAKDDTQIRQYRLAIRGLLVEFGHSPVARSRVKQIDEPKHAAPTSPFARLQGQAQQIRRVK